MHNKATRSHVVKSVQCLEHVVLSPALVEVHKHATSHAPIQIQMAILVQSIHVAVRVRPYKEHHTADVSVRIYRAILNVSIMVHFVSILTQSHMDTLAQNVPQMVMKKLKQILP